MSDEKNLVMAPMKVKNLCIIEWCYLCNKAKAASYTLVDASHSADEGVQDLPSMCSCEWWGQNFTTSHVGWNPSPSTYHVVQPPPVTPTYSFKAYQLTEYDLQRIRQIVAEEVKNVLQAVKEGHAGE